MLIYLNAPLLMFSVCNHCLFSQCTLESCPVCDGELSSPVRHSGKAVSFDITRDLILNNTRRGYLPPPYKGYLLACDSAGQEVQVLLYCLPAT